MYWNERRFVFRRVIFPNRLLPASKRVWTRGTSHTITCKLFPHNSSLFFVIQDQIDLWHTSLARRLVLETSVAHFIYSSCCVLLIFLLRCLILVKILSTLPTLLSKLSVMKV